MILKRTLVFCLLFPAFGFSTTQGNPACADLWQSSAKGEVHSGLRKVNELPNYNITFGSADTQEVLRFLRSPDVDGSVPFPLNSLVNVNGELSGRIFKMTFKPGSIHAQSESLRTLFRDMKSRSLSNSPQHEREFGAMVIEFEGGQTKVVKFTSNLIDAILARDQQREYDSVVDSSNVALVRRIIHIQTHPNPSNPRIDLNYIGPSPGDYDSLASLQEQIGKLSKSIRLEGVVLPHCRYCDDLFFYYLPNWIVPASP
jgi:hypothetical protein